MAKEYKTMQGDTWDALSLKFCGTEKLMHKLLEANPAYNTVVIFPAGITLKIPEIQAIDNEALSLPSWRVKR